MNILVLGAAGMLGHKVAQVLARDHRVFGTVRSDGNPAAETMLAAVCEELLFGVEVAHINTVVDAVTVAEPDVVLNCIGLVKQRPEARNPYANLRVNAMFPRRLAKICQSTNARLVHFSTDCVFSGRHGGYKETDRADADDLYGGTKLLGEVDGPGCVTVRTSMIGRELGKDGGLLEWFLRNCGGRVPGYRRAIFSGFPTVELARIIGWILEDHPELSGVYHVASSPIDKYELLTRIRDALDLDIEIVPDDSVEVDRSLDDSRFREATGFEPRSWDDLVRVLAEDVAPYDGWRTLRGPA